MSKQIYTVYCVDCDDVVFEGHKVECESWMKNNDFGYPEEDDYGWKGCCIDCSRLNS